MSKDDTNENEIGLNIPGEIQAYPDEEIRFSPTMRKNFVVLIVLFAILIGSIWMQLHFSGTAVTSISREFGISKFGFMRRPIKTHNFKQTFAVLSLLSYVILMSKWFSARKTSISANPLVITTRSGVLSQHADTIDLITVREQSISRNLFQIMSGVSTIEILSTDPKNPDWKIEGVKSKEAELFFDYLKKNSLRSVTALAVSRGATRPKGK